MTTEQQDFDVPFESSTTASPLQRLVKNKPTKPLPTERVQFATQISVLRAYAKASQAAGRMAVSNSDVASYAGISASSVSVCNPFWNDIGLLAREGIKQRPADAVFDFDAAVEWGNDAAGGKLAPVIENSWFARAILPRIALRSLTINDAQVILAEECRAPREYATQLGMLVDYLKFAGLIEVDGNTITKPNKKAETASMQTSPETPARPQSVEEAPEPTPSDVLRFEVPIPSKRSAIVTVPNDLDAEDWEMLKLMMDAYIERWKKFGKGGTS